MPFDQVREEHENRGNELPNIWLYSASNAWQKIKSVIEVVISHFPTHPLATIQTALFNNPVEQAKSNSMMRLVDAINRKMV